MRLTIASTFAAAVLAAGCAQEGVSSVSSVSSPIIGGAADPGDPAVVMLQISAFLCSGTLISSKIILTAGHCTSGSGLITAYFGQGAAEGQTPMTALQSYRHPGYQDNLATGGIVENDVALVVLEKRAPVPPVPPLTTLLGRGDIVGQPVQFVGFGATAGGGGASKEKLTVSSTVTDLTDQDLVYDSATCQGDSGGPGLFTLGGTQYVVGVTSFGDEGCAGQSWSQRVDIHADWIAKMIAQYDPPSCDRDYRCITGCPKGDADCPCAADGVCSPLCTDPDSDPDCPKGCGANGVCVKGPACPNPDPDCGDPCGAEGHCITTCATRDPDCPAPLALGAPCTTAFDCGAGNACVRADPTGPFQCAHECTVGDAAACGDGMACEALAGALPPIAVCRAAPPGGCTVGTGGGGGLAVLLLALLAASARRLRRDF